MKEATKGKTCDYTPIVVHFRGDIDFSPENKLLIEEACRVWKRTTNGLVNFDVTWDLDYTKGRPDASDRVIAELASNELAVIMFDSAAGGTVLGFTPKGPDIYLVTDRMPKGEDFLGVTMHEMGHAAGLHHMTTAGHLMSANHEPGVYEFDLADIDNLQRNCLIKSQ